MQITLELALFFNPLSKSASILFANKSQICSYLFKIITITLRYYFLWRTENSFVPILTSPPQPRFFTVVQKRPVTSSFKLLHGSLLVSKQTEHINSPQSPSLPGLHPPLRLIVFPMGQPSLWIFFSCSLLLLLNTGSSMWCSTLPEAFSPPYLVDSYLSLKSLFSGYILYKNLPHFPNQIKSPGPFPFSTKSNVTLYLLRLLVFTHCFSLLFINAYCPHSCKFHTDRNHLESAPPLSVSCLAQCLSHNRHILNISWVKE